MLEVILYLLVGLGLAAAAVIAFAATRPNTFRVARSIRIAAPPEAIFPLINDLRAFATWSPYETKDPDMSRTFSGPERGPGQRYDWSGDSNVGKGWLAIAQEVTSRQVDMDLNMLAPIKAKNRVTFTLEPDTLAPNDGATTVTWAMHGDVNLVGRVINLVIDSDRMCGNDFEEGLARLKSITEAGAPQAVRA